MFIELSIDDFLCSLNNGICNMCIDRPQASIHLRCGLFNHTQETRVERDSMGEMRVPISAYYGASTYRAVLNFPISDLRFPHAFMHALGQIKQSAAQVNASLGTIDAHIADAIIQAAQEVIDGKLDEHFVLDIFQTGSGTSTNMNANEVIANRASELLGGSRGSRKVHPNDHVNFGQSSNDVIPTAIHLSALVSIEHDLVPALEELQKALQDKADEFMPVIKTGRTHLQDATPIRLGQEFLGYAGQIERSVARVRHAQHELSEVALGGTAVGTGVNTHQKFAAEVCLHLSELMGSRSTRRATISRPRVHWIVSSRPVAYLIRWL